METYLDYIKNSGFKQVSIIDETIFSLDNVNNSEAFSDLADSLNIDVKDLEDVQKSILSIKVSAIK